MSEIPDFKLIQKAIALASTDSSYKSSLLSNSAAALEKVGFTVPEGVTIHFVEDGKSLPNTTPTDIYLPIDQVGSNVTLDLDEESLQAVAAGGSCSTTASTAFTVPSCLSSASSASTKC